MKRTIAILLVGFLAVAAVSGQTASLGAVAPKDPRSMAMGGAFVAMSEGYQSFFGNPASFGDKKAELTLVSVNPWVYVSPSQANIASAQDVVGYISDNTMEAAVGPLSDLIADNGFGAGVAAGLGWVGKGLGLGLVGGGDVYIDGQTLLGAEGTVDAQMAAVIGIGLPLQIGPLRFQAGGDLRPYLRMTGNLAATDLLGSVMGGDDAETFDPMSINVDVGFGLALDIGAKMDRGKMMSVGIAVRDIAPNMSLATLTLGEFLTALSTGDLPAGDKAYASIPNITLGASISPIPVPLRPLLDVLVVAELQDPLSVIEDIQTYGNASSMWGLFHVGAEAELLGGLIVGRVGINKGWISFGDRKSTV